MCHKSSCNKMVMRKRWRVSIVVILFLVGEYISIALASISVESSHHSGRDAVVDTFEIDGSGKVELPSKKLSETTGTDSSSISAETITLNSYDAKYCCNNTLYQISKSYDDIFDAKISFVIHRNGEPEPCSKGVIGVSIDTMKDSMSLLLVNCNNSDDNKMIQFNLFQTESFLTEYMAQSLSVLGDNGSFNDTDTVDGHGQGKDLLGYCDRGPDHTVVQKDHSLLIPVPSSGTLPCRWYTREGRLVSSIQVLANAALSARKKSMHCNTNNDCNPVLNLYAVPAGRVFMFAPAYVGESFMLDHVQSSNGTPIELKVLSVDPRVFDIINFFSMEESNALMEKALKEKSETHGFHRSTTGTSSVSIFSKRTSENAWDTHGATAMILKRRCFALLGFEKFDDAYADGLQILRYNLTTAYTPHMDYLEDKDNTEAYDYDTSRKGGNRFATILLYFNDLPDGAGGQTVFPRVWPPDLPVEDRLNSKTIIKQLRESGEISLLKPGSWEEEMTANCRSKFAVQPYAARAVLFYSQHPDGSPDQKSYHGGCPVLNGTKLAANLWTWSGIRPEFEGAPLKRELRPEEKKKKSSTMAATQVKAVFSNEKKLPEYDNAQLYYDEAGYFGEVGPQDVPVHVNTYKGHVWNVKDKHTKKTLTTFVIGSELEQEFVF